MVIIEFQSTRPRGARPKREELFAEYDKFQSTRPRGARLGGGIQVEVGKVVSIHAPAWGATRQAHPLGKFEAVSIHAPAWGATPTIPIQII